MFTKYQKGNASLKGRRARISAIRRPKAAEPFQAVSFSHAGPGILYNSLLSLPRIFPAVIGVFLASPALAGMKGLGTAPVLSLDFSADGKYLVTAAPKVKIWPLPDYERATELDVSADAVAVSPAKPLVAAWHDYKIDLLRLPDGKLEGTIEDAGKGTLMVFSPDGRYLAGAADSKNDGTILSIYDVAKRKEIATQGLAKEKKALSLAFTSDGRVVAGCLDKAYREWTWAKDGLSRLDVSENPILALTVLPSSGTIAFADGRDIWLYDIDGKNIRAFKALTDVRALAPAKRENALVIVTDETAYFWELDQPRGREKSEIQDLRTWGKATAARATPAGDWVAVGFGQGPHGFLLWTSGDLFRTDDRYACGLVVGAALKGAGDALTHVRAAGCFLEQRLPDMAMKEYDAALKINPKDALARRNRSLLWMAAGDSQAALSDAKAAVAEDPKDAKAMLAYGMLLFELDDEEAFSRLSDAKDLGAPEAGLYMGMIYIRKASAEKDPGLRVSYFDSAESYLAAYDKEMPGNKRVRGWIAQAKRERKSYIGSRIAEWRGETGAAASGGFSSIARGILSGLDSGGGGSRSSGTGGGDTGSAGGSAGSYRDYSKDIQDRIQRQEDAGLRKRINDKLWERR